MSVYDAAGAAEVAGAVVEARAEPGGMGEAVLSAAAIAGQSISGIAGGGRRETGEERCLQRAELLSFRSDARPCVCVRSCPFPPPLPPSSSPRSMHCKCEDSALDDEEDDD